MNVATDKCYVGQYHLSPPLAFLHNLKGYILAVGGSEWTTDSILVHGQP